MASSSEQLEERWAKKVGMKIRRRHDSGHTDLCRLAGLKVPRVCYDTSKILGYRMHIDHPFTVFDGRKVIAVGWEPYDRCISEFEELCACCRYHELEFTVSGFSPHYTGWTHTVLVYGKAYMDLQQNTERAYLPERRTTNRKST